MTYVEEYRQPLMLFLKQYLIYEKSSRVPEASTEK
jgi:hypothetical protein